MRLSSYSEESTKEYMATTRQLEISLGYVKARIVKLNAELKKDREKGKVLEGQLKASRAKDKAAPTKKSASKK